MHCPEAVRKHDGRIVAYDAGKLATSVARAACACDVSMPPDAARRLGGEIAQAVGAFMAGEGRTVPASADLRALTAKLLKETRQDCIAEAYAGHSRAASGLLWRIRVVEPGTPFTSSAGSPWDRRRLLESLRKCGVARDPAGDAAREVERRVVVLGQERVSPALIHALAAMVLAQRALDLRRYVSRRLSFSMSSHTPRFDPQAAEQEPLPQSGPALESFWLQAVHSQEVVACVTDNLLSLSPYPATPDNDRDFPLPAEAGDPLAVDNAAHIQDWAARGRAPLWLKCDNADRVARAAYDLGRLRDEPAGDGRANDGSAAVNLLLNGAGGWSKPARAGRAAPITINLAGLLAREALRDQMRAAVRMSQLVKTAALAHRQREEYFNLSPVRGRTLPVAVAGLWSAAAWMQGESFDAPRFSRAACAQAAGFVSVLRGAVDAVRGETGMALILSGEAPREAARSLWRHDREFFLRDGVALDTNSEYDTGPALRLSQSHADSSDRLDFLKSIACAFEFPPALALDVPLGGEPDAKVWRELIQGCAQAGIQRLQLRPGGSLRALRGVLKTLKSHLGGYPLFDLMDAGLPAPRNP
jgi:hypothetical protein